MIAPASIDQLLNIAVIEDVVGDYIGLKRAGSRYKGVCPFHDEKTPSFVVTPSLGIYKCFGCQKGGNAIGFIMEIENLGFTEATRQLARKYSFELQESHDENREEFKEGQKLRDNLQIVLDYALKFFTNSLHESEAGQSIGLPYFKERGYSTETIKKWELGFSPESWDALFNAASAAGYNVENLELAGLVRKKESGGHFDLFRNRVIFPILSVSGKVIAFAGRKMSNLDTGPKYVNSPETELYKKSDNLFGIFQAKNAIKKHDKVYLTEGYTDVITLAEHGVDNVVASSGTALTPGQIKLLRRFTPNVTVVYDGDVAGIKASLRGINLLLAEDLNVRVVSLPEGEDPDSYCKSLGAQAFAEYLAANEQNFIYFKARLLLDGAGEDPIRRTEAVRDILESVSEIKDALKRNALLKELARICGMDEALLASELARMVRKNSTQWEQDIVEEIRDLTQAAGIDLPRPAFTDEHQERALMRLLLLYADKPFNADMSVFEYVMKELAEDGDIEFSDTVCRRILSEIQAMEIPVWPGNTHFLHHADTAVAEWVAGVFSQSYQLSPRFEDNYIYVTEETDNFCHELVGIFLHLRRTKLDALMKKNAENLKETDQLLKVGGDNKALLEARLQELMEYQMYLSDFNLSVAKNLGATVFWI